MVMAMDILYILDLYRLIYVDFEQFSYVISHFSFDIWSNLLFFLKYSIIIFMWGIIFSLLYYINILSLFDYIEFYLFFTFLLHLYGILKLVLSGQCYFLLKIINFMKLVFDLTQNLNTTMTQKTFVTMVTVNFIWVTFLNCFKFILH